MAINCDTLDLRAFLLVLELGNFHRAAEMLNISQPALSRRIRKLEQTFGGEFFERTTRRVTPTAMGREVAPRIRRLLEDFDSTLFSYGDLGQSGSGLISIACIPTAAFYFLPEVIRRFGLRYPRIRFRVMDLPANQCIDAVAAGEVEFGISLIGTSNSELDFLPLAEDPFVLAARREHRLMKRKSVRWEDLAGEQIISVHRSSANRLLLDAALGRVNVRLDWKYEVTHLSTSLGLVEAGLGIAILPRMATPIDEHPILMTRPVVEPSISRTIGIVRRRNGSFSPAAERFHEMLLNEWSKALQTKAS